MDRETLRLQRGFALLEGAVIAAVLFPLFLALLGFLNYSREASQLHSLVDQALESCTVKSFDLGSGDQGLYLNLRGRHELGVGSESALTSELLEISKDLEREISRLNLCEGRKGLPCPRAHYRAETVYLPIQIDTNSGKITQLGVFDPTDPIGSHTTAVMTTRSFGVGTLSPSLAPQIGDELRAVQLQESRSANAASRFAIPSALHGVKLVQYYGLWENGTGATGTSEKITDQNQRRNYLRYSLAIGIGAQVDITDTFTGSVMRQILRPSDGKVVIKAYRVGVPRKML